MDPRFSVILEDGPVIVAYKPAGLSTQAPPGIDSLEAQVKAFLKERDNKPGGVYLALPHRLDRPVSGVIVLAKHVRAARRISEQFEGRTVTKTYWTCVSGRVEPAEGTWIDWMRKIPDQPQAEIVSDDHPDGRRAILHYRTLGQTPFGSWLEITLETGRMHQIRLQCAAHGHPVIGDLRYGSPVPFGMQYEDERKRAIALHARTIRLRHPMNQQWLHPVAPLPENWMELGVAEPSPVDDAARA